MRTSALYLSMFLACSNAHAGDTWRYVVPPLNDAFANPPPRILAVSSEKPADLKWEIADLGQRQRYAHLVYGSGRLAPIAIAVLEFLDGSVHLYVDADRDRVLSANERIAGMGREWRAEIKAMVADGDKNIEIPRTVFFRFSNVTRSLAAATCGYVEGSANIDGKTIKVRRVDGDCNGLLADAQDRVWANFDGDGQWDAVTEQHLVMPILRIDGRRFALRADVRGQNLSFTPLAGFGTIRLALPKHISESSIEDISVTLQDRDGLLATVRQLNGAVETPAGDYRVCALSITCKDAQGGPTWGYVFNDNNGRPPRWQTLAHGSVLTVNPLEKFEFGLNANDDVKAGDTLIVRPTWHSTDGLLIERAYRGAFSAFASGCHSTTTLVDAGGKVLTSETSGFA